MLPDLRPTTGILENTLPDLPSNMEYHHETFDLYLAVHVENTLPDLPSNMEYHHETFDLYLAVHVEMISAW